MGVLGGAQGVFMSLPRSFHRVRVCRPKKHFFFKSKGAAEKSKIGGDAEQKVEKNEIHFLLHFTKK